MEFSQTTSSSGVNIISADSSVVSTLEDDDQEVVSNTKTTSSSSSSSTSTVKKKDETVAPSSIKRETGAARSPYSNQKTTDRDSMQAGVFPHTNLHVQQPPPKGGGGGFYSRPTHPQLKTTKFNAMSPQNEYLAGHHYLNRQQAADFGSKGEQPMYNDLQKVMMRPQQHVHFNQHHKAEGESSLAN